MLLTAKKGVYSKTFPRNTSSFLFFLKKAPTPQYTHAAATVRALREALKSLDRLRGHPLSFYVCSHPSGAVSRTEDASGAAGGCPQSVESAVLRAFEDASRTTGACFVHRISLPYRKSLFFTPNASENASRTPGSLFEHGTHIPYRKSLFLVPSPHTEASCRRSVAWRTF